MALNTAAIADAISKLSVSGVTLKDIDQVPKSIVKANLPIFFPHPDEWFQGTRSEPGPGGLHTGHTGVYDAIRTFRYIYLHSLSTAANTIASQYPGMAGKVDLLYSAIAGMNRSSGVLTVRSINVSEFGEIIAPPAGTSQIRNVFYGAFFTIEILEQSTS